MGSIISLQRKKTIEKFTFYESGVGAYSGEGGEGGEELIPSVVVI